MKKTLPFALLSLALCAPAAIAAPVPVEGCVDLSSSHEGMRYGSKYVLIKDGDAHYRLDFGRACSAITASGSITIEAEGEANRICASGTKVDTGRGDCNVRKVEAIDAETFARYKKRR